LTNGALTELGFIQWMPKPSGAYPGCNTNLDR